MPKQWLGLHGINVNSLIMDEIFLLLSGVTFDIYIQHEIALKSP